MPHPGFVNDFECAAQLLVACLGNGGVFRHGHDLIRIPHHVDDGDARLGERGKIIERITLIGERLCFRHAVGFQAGLPAFTFTLACALASRPTLEIHHRRITIDRRYLLGVSRSPVINDQPTAGHAL